MLGRDEVLNAARRARKMPTMASMAAQGICERMLVASNIWFFTGPKYRWNMSPRPNSTDEYVALKSHQHRPRIHVTWTNLHQRNTVFPGARTHGQGGISHPELPLKRAITYRHTSFFKSGE